MTNSLQHTLALDLNGGVVRPDNRLEHGHAPFTGGCGSSHSWHHAEDVDARLGNHDSMRQVLQVVDDCGLLRLVSTGMHWLSVSLIAAYHNCMNGNDLQRNQ